MSKKQPDDGQQMALELTLGQRLRAARQERNLSIEDVADHFRLASPAVIEAIELDSAPDPSVVAFMRGYTRSYARFLNVPSREVDEAFRHLGWAVKGKNDCVAVFDMSETTSKDKPMRLMTYALIGIFFVMILLWHFLHRDTATPVVAVIAPQHTDVAPVAQSGNMMLLQASQGGAMERLRPTITAENS